MAGTLQYFYDDLSSNYHLIFEDWEATMASQAAALGPIPVRECGSAMSMTILDCACWVGTQTLGLAKVGFFRESKFRSATIRTDQKFGKYLNDL